MAVTAIICLTLLFVTSTLSIDTLIRPETSEEKSSEEVYNLTPAPTTTKKPRKKEIILEIYDELVRDPKLDIFNEDVVHTVAYFANKLGIQNYKRDIIHAERSVDDSDPIMIFMPNDAVREKWIEAYRRGSFMKKDWYMARRDYGDEFSNEEEHDYYANEHNDEYEEYETYESYDDDEDTEESDEDYTDEDNDKDMEDHTQTGKIHDHNVLGIENKHKHHIGHKHDYNMFGTENKHKHHTGHKHDKFGIENKHKHHIGHKHDNNLFGIENKHTHQHKYDHNLFGIEKKHKQHIGHKHDHNMFGTENKHQIRHKHDHMEQKEEHRANNDEYHDTNEETSHHDDDDDDESSEYYDDKMPRRPKFRDRFDHNYQRIANYSEILKQQQQQQLHQYLLRQQEKQQLLFDHTHKEDHTEPNFKNLIENEGAPNIEERKMEDNNDDDYASNGDDYA